jgi:putative membrane protein
MGLMALGWLYALLTGPWRAVVAPGARYPARHAILFYSGLFAAYLALGSPLDHAAMVFLLSAHVVQDLFLLYPVPALLLLGIPPWLADRAVYRAVVRRPLGWVLSPLVCGALFVLVIGVWHMPRPFESALQSPVVQAARVGSMVGVGLFFWWPLLSPSRLLPHAAPGIQAVYLFCVQVAFTALFSYVFMADSALYPTYQFAPRLFAGLSPIEDQRLAAVLLGLVSSLVFIGALGAGFFRWARHSEKATRQR